MKAAAIILTGLCVTLAACGSPSINERRESPRNRTLNDAIWAARTATTVNGRSYAVGVHPEKTYALVAPSTGKFWIMSEMVLAVDRVTGCEGKPDYLLASIVRGDLDEPIDISKVDANITRMRSDLDC